MEYKQTLTAFIDILGFRDHVNLSYKEPGMLNLLYETLNILKRESIEVGIYECSTLVMDNGFQYIMDRETHMQFVKQQFPISISQFSDSIVISSEIDRAGNSSLLIFFVAMLIRRLTFSGFYVRGGLAVGALVHEDGGSLFGPAMNTAYDLESKYAKNPRIIMTLEDFQALDALWLHPLITNILLQDSADGYKQITIASAFKMYVFQKNGSEEIFEALSRINKIIEQGYSIFKDNREIVAKYKFILDNWADTIGTKDQMKTEVDAFMVRVEAGEFTR